MQQLLDRLPVAGVEIAGRLDQPVGAAGGGQRRLPAGFGGAAAGAIGDQRGARLCPADHRPRAGRGGAVRADLRRNTALAPEVTRRRMYYETMERILSRVDTTIVEAPGVTPYLPLPALQGRPLPAAPDPGRAAAMNSSLRNPIVIGIIAILLLILVASTFSIVPETKQAVIVRFGEPQRVLNRYQRERDVRPLGRARRADPVHRADPLDRQAHPLARDGEPAGPFDRSAAPPGRCLRPLPDRRSVANVHLGAHRGESGGSAPADPRLGAPQRARPAPVRRPC